jgi:small subunit ribosomal protein S21
VPAKARGSVWRQSFLSRPLICNKGQQEAPQETNPNRIGGELQVAEVIIQESESLENALRRFKRKVQQEDIIKEIKKHSFYMKPGEKRRTKEALSRKRLRKKMRRETE